MRLSENFTLAEFIVSDTFPELARKVEITTHDIDCLKLLCECALQPIRNRWGAIKITSGKRSKALNKAVKGSTNSDHLHAIACDFVCLDSDVDMFNVFKWVVPSPHSSSSPIPYRQVIYYPEQNFIHISINKPSLPYKWEALIKKGKEYREWLI